MSEVKEIGALRAGNTVESLRPTPVQAEVKYDPARRPRFEIVNNDFVMVEPEEIVEKLADDGLELRIPALPFQAPPQPPTVEFEAGIGETFDGTPIDAPNPTPPPPPFTPKATSSETVYTYAQQKDIELLFLSIRRLVRELEALSARVATLETRIDNHNVRGSHKI